MSKIPPPPKDLVIPAKKPERSSARPDPDMDQTVYKIDFSNDGIRRAWDKLGK